MVRTQRTGSLHSDSSESGLMGGKQPLSRAVDHLTDSTYATFFDAASKRNVATVLQAHYPMKKPWYSCAKASRRLVAETAFFIDVYT